MAPERPNLLVIGAGGHSRVVIDAAEGAGFAIVGVIDVDYKIELERILDYPVLGDFSKLNDFDANEVSVIIALGDGSQRATYFENARDLGFSVRTIIHGTAIVSRHAAIGEGVVINAGAIVNAKAKVGDNTIVNTGAIIEHEVKIGKHTHICPGVKIAGRSTVGDLTLVGIGTSIVEKVTVGDHVTIGAGSVVLDDVESGAIVAGVPAKRIR